MNCYLYVVHTYKSFVFMSLHVIHVIETNKDQDDTEDVVQMKDDLSYEEINEGLLCFSTCVCSLLSSVPHFLSLFFFIHQYFIHSYSFCTEVCRKL